VKEIGRECSPRASDSPGSAYGLFAPGWQRGISARMDRLMGTSRLIRRPRAAQARTPKESPEIRHHFSSRNPRTTTSPRRGSPETWMPRFRTACISIRPAPA